MINIIRSVIALLIMYILVMPLVTVAVVFGYIAYKVGGK